jgi:hypothetical protein
VVVDGIWWGGLRQQRQGGEQGSGGGDEAGHGCECRACAGGPDLHATEMNWGLYHRVVFDVRFPTHQRRV